MTPPSPSRPRVALVGGGPAGLMAAEVLAASGRVDVHLYDAKPSVGRKFLLAGKGGLNLTHSEAFEPFLARFGAEAPQIEPWLRAFDGEAVRAWARELGVETFVGTSGRVFPADLKAAPLLRAWLHRLRQAGVHFHMRHRWLGFSASGQPRFANAQGEVIEAPCQATLLALGGASWPQLGSDGAWVPELQRLGAQVTPLQPANCGFDVGWSAKLAEHAGEPVKPVILHTVDSNGQAFSRQGEFVVTATGVEGSLIYAASRPLREALNATGQARIELDLLPQHSPERVLAEVKHPRGSRSLGSHLKSRLGLGGVKAALLHEVLSRDEMLNAAVLAERIKRLPLILKAPRPVAEAISTAGGVAWASLDDGLMLRACPGVFCAGEMLDWEAPTGGYLLTASFASGRAAAHGMLRWLPQG
ncbi:TIGR03862 family flavoprotein [Roseateles sp. DJS-2-20]|uniref:TIGR03862 family flavoprotein n=1 Tax=Roseateles paludis TaxID=3145238 RepID=A0ABV0G0A4_9BURK